MFLLISGWVLIGCFVTFVVLPMTIVYGCNYSGFYKRTCYKNEWYLFDDGTEPLNALTISFWPALLIMCLIYIICTGLYYGLYAKHTRMEKFMRNLEKYPERFNIIQHPFVFGVNDKETKEPFVVVSCKNGWEFQDSTWKYFYRNKPDDNEIQRVYNFIEYLYNKDSVKAQKDKELADKQEMYNKVSDYFKDLK